MSDKITKDWVNVSAGLNHLFFTCAFCERTCKFDDREPDVTIKVCTCGAVHHRYERTSTKIDENQTITRRTFEELWNLIFEAIPFVKDRFLDPKNMAKGGWLDIPADKMYRWIQHEALEASQAYRNKEGIGRELEECSDQILLNLMRMNQILYEKKIKELLQKQEENNESE